MPSARVPGLKAEPPAPTVVWGTKLPVSSGERVSAYCSTDGGRWFSVGSATLPAQSPVQIGVHAMGKIDRAVYRGAYPDGTAIRFEGFQIWQR